MLHKTAPNSIEDAMLKHLEVIVFEERDIPDLLKIWIEKHKSKQRCNM